MNKRDHSEQQTVTGETGHKYFTQMLNMAEDDLDPFQYRLLAHYLRWAGHGGAKQQSIKETAKACQMSENKVRSTRAELVELGYLCVPYLIRFVLKEVLPSQHIGRDHAVEAAVKQGFNQ